jgi:hypothetical protein
LACQQFSLGGSSYIDYDSGTGVSNVTGTDMTTALTCMSAVGTCGCGFEHSLESLYQAVTTSNPGFVRDDALLAIVFLTDEDDCSAAPDTDLFDPSADQYGPFGSFRCTQFGVTCDGDITQGGTFANCRPIPGGGKLFDVSRYTRLLTADRAGGGLKDDLGGVVMLGLVSPAEPFTTTVMSPCSYPPVASCTSLSSACPMVPVAPAVRIHAVMGSLPNVIDASICALDYYGPALDALTGAIGQLRPGGCLPGALGDPARPSCTVFAGGVSIPPCTAQQPCWAVVDDPECPARPTPDSTTEHLRLVVQGAMTDISASCELYAPIL